MHKFIEPDDAEIERLRTAYACEPTDISARLRKFANGSFDGSYAQEQLMLTAADEIDRYYGGMLAWKRTAEKKDADWNAERMGRVNDRIASRTASSDLSLPELAEQFAAIAELGCNYVLTAASCAKLFAAMTTPPEAAQPQAAIQAPAEHNKHFTPMQARGTLVYLGRSGGFDVRDCPEAESLAQFIAASCNAALAAPAPAVAAPSDEPSGYIATAIIGSQHTAVAFKDIETARRMIVKGDIVPFWTAALAAPTGASQSADTHAFKNFHRNLCARFGYVHDEIDWRRDQVSLEEFIAKQIAHPAAMPAQASAKAEDIAALVIRDVCEISYEGDFDEERMVVATIEDLTRIIKRHTPAPAPAIQAQPLTDATIHELMSQTVDCEYQQGINFARAIERHLAGQTGGA